MGEKIQVIATGFNTVQKTGGLPAQEPKIAVPLEPEPAPSQRPSRFFVPGGPNTEYGVNIGDEYEIPAILRKQMD